jgi:hypothetical protein
MKLTYDTNTKEFKFGGKNFNELPEEKKQAAIGILNDLVLHNSKLSNYEEDSVWMSYRYCIGRHTIASHMRAGDIWKHCKGRMKKERQLFNAFDINREIEQHMQFGTGPEWRFPITSLNRIYTTAIDIFCEFLEDYDIKSKEDYLKYYAIDVILTDNECGYKIETTTWEEKLTSMIPVFKEVYDLENVEDIIKLIKVLQKKSTDDVDSRIRWVIHSYPNPEYFYFNDIEDLFVWNDLAHCFDHEHHHKSILVDGTECEWFWSWTNKSEQHDDGYYYRAFGYKRIRVPLDKWNGTVTTWIPDESIKEDLY